MRVAILHDYLNQFGGAERVLEVILELFPDADLYTLLYDEGKTKGLFAGRVTKTSFLDLPFIRSHHRAFIPFMPFAAKLLRSRKNPYDLVISSAAGYGKGINVNGSYHVCYCHSPLRYAWEIDYLKDLPFSPGPLSRGSLRPIARWLARWDYTAAQSVNLFVANSEHIARKINAYYGRESTVVFPPVDTKLFYPEPRASVSDYYLMVGRLLYYKRFDLGIQAFNRLRKPLLVIGAGPEMEKLKTLNHSPYTTFLSDVSDGDLRKYYTHAKAFIFPQIEDFGLVAAEAQACGTPVIAYREGGAPEIVIEGRTGVLFGKQTVEALMDAVGAFEKLKWNRAAIAKSAQRFSKETFKRRFCEVLRNAGVTVEV
ncbi:MAG: glycosyltransferase [Candidatus Jorgensenbacteria bacterium]